MQRVEVRGNRQVSSQKITRVVGVKPGDRYEPDRIRLGLKRLFETHQFSDIHALREDGSKADSVVVVIEVVEYPRVDEVGFEGNDHIGDDDLRKAISAAKGTFVRPSVTDKDRETISDQYREKGYYRVSVRDTLKVDARDGKRELVYRVREGRKVKIKHIDFIGTGQMDTEEIRKVMKSKPDGFLSGGDFNPRELDDDKERIIQLYKSKGFLDVAVQDPELDFAADGKGLDVYFTVEEGTRYYVGDIKWSGNELFADTTIAQLITLKKGRPLDDLELSQIQFNIANLYGDRGYIYATVTPVKKVRGDVMDLNFEIEQGNLAHVRQINITGNTKTWEGVIRRELVLQPGDVFSSNRLRRSLREVFNLGFFAGPPEPQVTQANNDGDIDLNLKVEEKSAGQFRVGAGFSQLNRVSGFIGVTEPNFLGRGYRVGVNWEFSQTRQDISLQFTQPWAFGTPTELSFQLYSANQEKVSAQFYSDRRTGFSVRVGRPLPWLDYTSASVRYSLEEVELTNFSPNYAGPLRLTQWPQTTSSVGVTLFRNSTDNPFHPTTGSRTTLNTRWTGATLGGDVNIQRYDLEVSWFQSLAWKFVLELRQSFGVVDGYQSPAQVPDYERFRLGGNRKLGVRGYDFYEIVPKGNNPYTGGRAYSITVGQIEFPVVPPTVYGHFFLDMGGTWNSFGSAEMGDVRKGAGFGVGIELPMIGLFGFDYGYGFDRLFGGRWQAHITFGNSF
ncbi:MAG TPA: outer membrane protein assembly factor BamA [Candidatus Krumholzibacteria bacterium]|nr:outer membrane protein assembly factor BamA [Candidatus Krumholzibacteria bacterium]